MLITFSGLDGAGKSTLIQGLKTVLEKQNRRVTVLTMYDHVGLYAFIRFVRDWIKWVVRRVNWRQARRGRFSNNPHRLGDQTVEHGWFMSVALGVLRSSAVKQCVYIFDLFILLLYRLYMEKVKNRILIIDRYFYDSLVDVADGHRWLYIRLFLSITPTPNAPILVDVSPEEAFARKGEYPLEHMKRRRVMYQKIFGWVRRPIVLINDDLNATLRSLEITVKERMTEQ